MRAALIILCAILLGAQTAWTEQSRKDMHNIKTTSRPFKSGEKLTYTVSWSRLVKAGVATLEVKSGKTKNGRRIYTVTSVARSAGFVSTFYKIRDTVQSIIDAEELYSLSYSIDSRHRWHCSSSTPLIDPQRYRVPSRSMPSSRMTPSSPSRDTARGNTRSRLASAILPVNTRPASAAVYRSRRSGKWLVITRVYYILYRDVSKKNPRYQALSTNTTAVCETRV